MKHLSQDKFNHPTFFLGMNNFFLAWNSHKFHLFPLERSLVKSKGRTAGTRAAQIGTGTNTNCYDRQEDDKRVPYYNL